MKEKLLTFLIDDDVDDQDIFIMAMEEAHPTMKCVCVNDGVHAIEKFKSDRSFIPHLIFIDINMPLMNGIDCLKEIKKMPKLRDVPAYMYSTSADPAIVEECMKIGAIGFIKKAVMVGELQATLELIIENLKSTGADGKD